MGIDSIEMRTSKQRRGDSRIEILFYFIFFLSLHIKTALIHFIFKITVFFLTPQSCLLFFFFFFFEIKVLYTGAQAQSSHNYKICNYN
jgi:hypothetical protein